MRKTEKGRESLPSPGLVSASENWTAQININPNRTCIWILTLLYCEADLTSPIDSLVQP